MGTRLEAMLDRAPIERSDSIHQQVYQRLRQAIISGEIRAGARVVEAQIAARLRISRAPVREALRRLEQERLVRSIPGRGAVVAGLSADEVRDVYGCRAALEGMAVKIAAERRDVALASRLRAILAKCETAIQRRDVDTILALNNEFHDLLVGATGNRLLAELMGELRDRILLYRRTAIQELPATAELSQAAHLRIVDAIERGDADGGRGIAEAHVFQIHEALVRYLARHDARESNPSGPAGETSG